MRLTIAATVAIVLVCCHSADSLKVSSRVRNGERETNLKDDVDYNNPVRSAADDEVKDLPGLNGPIDFKQYSGYLKADTEGSKFLHYWFVESQSDPESDPVILWLNGGPGCSSLGGMFTELGPFVVNDDGKTLRMNDYSWNKLANVLFLESPTGVGFSYTTSLINIHTDDSTADENHLALRSFFEKFPHLKNNSLYLTGESYAGVYLPTLGVLVDKDSALNLKGIAIGNGYLDVGRLTDSLVFFAYYHGLIGETAWKKISESCCNSKPPTRESCTLSGKESSWSCSFAVSSVMAVLTNSGLNPYNLYGKCESVSSSSTPMRRQLYQDQNHLARESVDRALRELTLNSTILDDSRPFHVFEAKKRDLASGQLGVEPPCFDDHLLINYLRDDAVRRAIHVPSKVESWDTCDMLIYVVKYPKLPGGLAPQMNSLIESKRNLTMLVYNGDVDTVCNFLGDEWFVDDLGRTMLVDYTTWRVNNQIAGFVKHYDGITFATVRGSGHMVPGDRPQEALEMIRKFLNANHKNVFL